MAWALVLGDTVDRKIRLPTFNGKYRPKPEGLVLPNQQGRRDFQEKALNNIIQVPVPENRNRCPRREA